MRTLVAPSKYSMGNLNCKIVAETMTPQVTEANVSFENTARVIRARNNSPHVLNLRLPAKQQTNLAAVKQQKKLPRGWHLLLNQRIYLKDMRYRTMSIRPRGWRDLPSPQAKTLWGAMTIAIRQFFAESPLAELTLVALLQTMAILLWKLLTVPMSEYGQQSKSAESESTYLRPIMPLIPMMIAEESTQPLVSLRSLNPARWRPALAYAAIMLAAVLPFGTNSSISSLLTTKDVVIQRGLLAVSHLRVASAAAQAQDFGGAEASFALAELEFSGVKNELGVLSSVLTAAGSIAPSTAVSTAGLMLVAGEELSEGGKYLSAGLTKLGTDAPPADRLRGMNEGVSRALPHLQRAANAIAMVSADSLPEEYRSTLDLAKAELPKLISTVEEASNIAGFLALMMGSDEPRRYLLVFQNNAELRPTGGFIGSYALLDVNRGEIVNLEVPGGGSYDLQGQLTAKVASPKPLRLINPHWQFQDANWSPDFPTSARRLTWFYEKSGGPTVDGVIAINATVMERLLAVLGPVEMIDYDVTLTADNFIATTQQEVEIDYDREVNRPKQILADLAPQVLSRVLEADRNSYMDLARALQAALSAKEIQLWFNDAELQNQTVDFGWAGQMQPATGDYLHIVHTNIAGQKTDAVMDETISHEVKVLADGSAIVTLKINRTHRGIAGELFTGVRNVDYLRVYVPLGSQLVEAEGFNIPDPKLFELPESGYESDPVIAAREERELLDRRSGTRTFSENGKTVFANWVQTDPGTSSEVKLIYQLPLEAIRLQQPEGGKLASLYAQLTNGAESHRLAYSLLVQKQSGSNPMEFVSSVDLPRGFRIISESPPYETDERGREISTTRIEADRTFELIAESPLNID
ncbi:MAG: DUF4012 domain-containing protein [Patescibacteria group bacterium]